jgi:hypothetical protein
VSLSSIPVVITLESFSGGSSDPLSGGDVEALAAGNATVRFLMLGCSACEKTEHIILFSTVSFHLSQQKIRA